MTKRYRATLALFGMGLTLFAACKSSSTTDPVQSDLDKLTMAMAPYDNFSAAVSAGYADAITPCWYFTGEGAMGYHQGKVSLIDGIPTLLEPEALMYEPQADQSLRFVGVEYIVPIDAWVGSDRPVLFDREFSRNDALGLYTLHVWIGKTNPSGMFADWNPDVSCTHADESEDRSAGPSMHHTHGSATTPDEG